MKDKETSNAVIAAIGGEIVMRPIFPGGDPVRLSDRQAAITAAYKRADEMREKLDAIPEDAPIAAWKEMRKALKADDESARDFKSDFADACADHMGMKPVLMQLDVRKGHSIDPCCIRGRYKSMIEECDAHIAALTPPPELHTYVIRCEITDGQLEKMLKDLDKQGFRHEHAKPQSDKAVKAIDKFMDDNKQR